MKDGVGSFEIVGRQFLDLVDDCRLLTDGRSSGTASARYGQWWSADRGVEPVVVVGSDEYLPEFGQALEPAALRIGVAPIRVKDGVEFDREIVFALQTPGDRQFHPGVLLA